MLTRVPDPRQFGVAELDEAGQVIGLEEKPARPKSDLALVGVYMFTPAVHEALRQLRPGPFTSVAEDCDIADSEIEYSIVLRAASIQGVRRIEVSLIGHEVEVTPAPRVPKAHRLILGDYSKVQISS